MGFLSESNAAPSNYLAITEESKLIRPTASKPHSIWVHKIHEVSTVGPDGKPQVIRKFRHETCTAIGRNGSGCYLCNTQDPLWHMLSNTEQCNSKGKRVDFPKTPLHHLPVFEHGTGDVFILRGGNGVYEDMDKWYDTQPANAQDLRRCDWRISKAGKGMRTKYKVTREDATAFNFTPELEEKSKQAMIRMMEDRRPTDPAQLAKIIVGEQGGVALPAPSTPPIQALPSTQTVPQFALPQFASPQFASPPVVTPPVVSMPPPQSQVAAKVQPTAPVVQVMAETGQAADRKAIDIFSGWVSSQPEFQGMKAVENLIPALKEKIGHVDYHKLSEPQINDLKAFLEAKLNTLRSM